MYRHPLVQLRTFIRKAPQNTSNRRWLSLRRCSTGVSPGAAFQGTLYVFIQDHTVFFLIQAYFILKYLPLFKRLFVLLYLNIYICHCGLAGRGTGIMYMLLFVTILM